MFLKSTLKVLALAVITLPTQAFGDALPQQLGLYEDPDKGFLEVRLFDFTRSLSLSFNAYEYNKAQTGNIGLTASQAWDVFESEKNVTVQVERSGFSTTLKGSTDATGERLVTLSQTWTDAESGRRVKERTLNFKLSGGFAEVTGMGRSLKGIQVGPVEVPTIWTTDFQINVPLVLPRTQFGIGLYGDNTGVRFGRIIQESTAREALKGDPNSSLNSVTPELLKRLCELECVD